MSQTTKHTAINAGLNFSTLSSQPVAAYGVDVATTCEDETLVECCLSVTVSYDRYQRIETEALFNLQPEVRKKSSTAQFQPNAAIEIELRLKADLLPVLTKHVATVAEAANYLCKDSGSEDLTKGEKNIM